MRASSCSTFNLLCVCHNLQKDFVFLDLLPSSSNTRQKYLTHEQSPYGSKTNLTSKNMDLEMKAMKQSSLWQWPSIINAQKVPSTEIRTDLWISSRLHGTICGTKTSWIEWYFTTGCDPGTMQWRSCFTGSFCISMFFVLRKTSWCKLFKVRMSLWLSF